MIRRSPVQLSFGRKGFGYRHADMRASRQVLAWAAVVALCAFAAARGASLHAQDHLPTVSASPAPSPEQLRALLLQLVDNQHRNDQSIHDFERFERTISRKAGENSEISSDLTYRVMFSGTGILRMHVAEGGVPVPPEYYRTQLKGAIGALDVAVHPNDRYRQDYAKFQKRTRERRELLDNAMKAFRVTWAGRETRGSRTLAKLLLEPDPSYKPTSRITGVFQHVRVTLWIDESDAQTARLEADIVDDVSFGGGIFGKIYRGGRFVMEQAEIEPGVWLPTLFDYNVDGRKFLFGFGVHDRTEIDRYRRVGPPAQALKFLRQELNGMSAQAPML